MNNERYWATAAVCATAEPDTLFVRGAAQREARRLCFGCPVRLACLADALNSGTEFGVWGGKTERERRALLRQNPYVTDWTSWVAEHADELAPAGSGRRRSPASVAS